MGGTVDAHLAQLVGGLVGHGAVALHDPGGDLLVPLPGGVLHHHAVLGLGGLCGGHADALVVVDVLDGHLGAFLGNVVVAGLAAALGHMYHGLLSQLVGGPGNTTAVVAVGGGEEGGLAELFKEPPSTLKALRPKRKDSSFTYNPARPRYLAMPSRRARGVMEYWGKLLWKKRALATLLRDMIPSWRSSLAGM